MKRGTRSRAKRLLAKGLPFDPEAAGLESHEILVSDEEVVFVFEASGQHLRDRLVAGASAWTAGGAWKDLVVAAPRFAETVYVSRRFDAQDQLSSAPTPGPGDSDGGDIFAP
jgi:hypothetical protein